jgi:hypothetical protein
MDTLILCPGCQRHVRSDENRCPFCGTIPAPLEPQESVSTTGMSRAQVFALGAALATGIAGSVAASPSLHPNTATSPHPAIALPPYGTTGAWAKPHPPQHGADACHTPKKSSDGDEQ